MPWMKRPTSITVMSGARAEITHPAAKRVPARMKDHRKPKAMAIRPVKALSMIVASM